MSCRGCTAARRDWFAAAERPGDALRHAAQAEAWDVAAALAAAHWLPLLLAGEITTLRGVLDGFPAARIAGDAELALAMAATRLDVGEWEAGLPLLERAEELAGSVPPDRAADFALGVAVARLVDARVRGRAAAADVAADRIALARPPREIRAFAELNVGLVAALDRPRGGGRGVPARRPARRRRPPGTPGWSCSRAATSPCTPF